jgi:hypothetical protein
MDIIKIVEYGEHPHPKGLQRVNHDVALRLVGAFHSLRGLLARRFGGLPVYVGHPDDPEFAGKAGHADTRAHGWIHELEAREDGLYGRIRWAKSGRELVENENYRFFSPRWLMKDIGGGVFEPVRLISVGLTNTPNIPGEAIGPLAGNCAPAGDGVFAGVCPVVSAGAGQVVAANMPEGFGSCYTSGLGLRREPGVKRQAIVDAVHSRMASTGEDFPSAWASLKRTRADMQ